jgi:hypothetical protein
LGAFVMGSIFGCCLSSHLALRLVWGFFIWILGVKCLFWAMGSGSGDFATGIVLSCACGAIDGHVIRGRRFVLRWEQKVQKRRTLWPGNTHKGHTLSG